MKSLKSTLQRFSSRHLAKAQKRINITFELQMACYAPQSMSTSVPVSSLQPTDLVNSYNPQPPAPAFNCGNLKLSIFTLTLEGFVLFVFACIGSIQSQKPTLQVLEQKGIFVNIMSEFYFCWLNVGHIFLYSTINSCVLLRKTCRFSY